MILNKNLNNLINHNMSTLKMCLYFYLCTISLFLFYQSVNLSLSLNYVSKLVCHSIYILPLCSYVSLTDHPIISFRLNKGWRIKFENEIQKSKIQILTCKDNFIIRPRHGNFSKYIFKTFSLIFCSLLF